MSNSAFLSEFPPIRTDEWEKAIRESVSGPEYPAKLIWHPEEGLAVKPYYRAEDIAGLPFAAHLESLYARGLRATADWRIRERVDMADPEQANRTACETAEAGADEIAFVHPAIETCSDVALLLANLKASVHFVGLGRPAVQTTLQRLQKSPHPESISFDLDPLDDLNFTAEMLNAALPASRIFEIDATSFHESGAGTIEEVAFAIACSADFLAQMQERNISIDRTAQSIGFSFAMGPEFYLQIAKLRAFRMLWSKVLEAFGGDPAADKLMVHARTANWNKTAYDSHVNILRATTETISAVLGGADSISVTAFDDCYRQPDDNSRRLARNTQLILKHEAHLARVVDPTGGSYLIEAITNSIASKAWKLFQELEDCGGFQKAREAGIVSSVLKRRECLRQQAVNHRQLVLTGTNRYPDCSDRASERVDLVRLRISKHASIEFENLRLRMERATLAGIMPRIVLAEIGDSKMRTARSHFVAEFLSCAGLSASTQVFGSSAQIARSQADVLVLCSSDPEYSSVVSELMANLTTTGKPRCVLVAGNPVDREQLAALGVSDFIHVGSDAVAVLSRLLQQIGIGE
ncbi:MAG TPA: methylmalonyl-CoA mutase family protein [Terracidiphilus sp.]|nr:methylmalonyl-CoA mutase family protein [Terracidiphilus sp.]